MVEKRKNDMRGVSVRTYRSGNRVVEIQFTYRGVRCRESFTTLEPDKKADLRYAANLRAEILSRIERQTFVYTDYFPNSKRAEKFGLAVTQLTVKQAQDALIADQAGAGLEATTIATYRKAAERINGYLGADTLLKDLTPESFRQMFRQRSVTRKTWNNDLSTIRRALRRAVNDGAIQISPLDRLDINEMVPKASKPLPDPFTLAEVEQICAAAQGDVLNLIEFAFFTGMRIEEIAGLCWPQVVDGKAEVMQAAMLSMLSSECKPPKTESGRRTVDLLPRALAAIERQKPLTRWGQDRVFTKPGTKAPIRMYKDINVHWKAVLEAAGVRYRPFRNTRHTYITHMLGSGQNPLYVASQAGHKGTVMQGVYARWVEEWKNGYEQEFGKVECVKT